MGEEFQVGATAVGIRAKDGVVLAAEKRVSYGFYTLSTAGKKVFIVNDKLAIASAGIIADMQALAKILKLNARSYELEVKKKPTVKAMAKLLSVVMFSRRFMPFYAEVLVGGVDEEGPHLIVMDPLGSLIEDNYAALGTGAKLAVSLLDASYRPDMTVEEAKKLAVQAVKAAIERDPVSGGGIDLVVVDGGGAREEEVKVQVVI
ncbi:archaeal proteasome endopeptidase complex subunit beta [Pyrobaculum neutrophilum]|uniref:Proteasome subunit beta 2 n=1 Tax=Pyrobaculum neutrophilum (strain DSM 2338 / JCM 9278 / NBRC 100436 / V24Sta) TaxID=444157 RepID=PSB2_PYRNV|nr:archaeal proteasome endopeptidase complex subunit beta [Pyrobaculum neutrophilum]B1YDJ0.1 RecName: Full=Proteasome subunit beta 2; AltName: Full=20S proteasome beta subunit 2; AltName: Full=Proteasome core protein PsmB 2; Flags: Precursor [Pyrobaculum neutrophilum V24Sta]ACB39853.1 Proteasome endopeptidase complex [Pyrobaculum neutrophilum V24Sta]